MINGCPGLPNLSSRALAALTTTVMDDLPYIASFPTAAVLTIFLLLACRYAGVAGLTHLIHRNPKYLVRADTTAPPPPRVPKQSPLPPDWFTSPTLLPLENRALHSTTWHALLHSSRLASPGSYITLTLATYPLILIRGRDDVIRAFHNVCRHRAYAVARKETGKSLVLRCGYHGWCYDARGGLVKAPQFEGVEGFAREENGLFEVGCVTDGDGLVWVNLDRRRERGMPEKHEIGEWARQRGMRMEEGVWVEGWNIEGEFNWKVAGMLFLPCR